MKKGEKTGFSILEVFITIFIIGVILILYQASLSGFYIIRTVKDQEIALRVANNKLEELRSAGYDNIPSTGSFNNPQLSDFLDKSSILTVEDFNAETKQITVTINWREKAGAPFKNVSLTTLVTKNGGI
ncbi:MAG: type II secretion system protein [Candidatus Moranbacteria bacterium]|nr:type II secretion system protein [Candidatus Moranbacteria bacterium]